MYEIVDPFAKAYSPDPGDASNVRTVACVVPTGRHVGHANKLVRARNSNGGGGRNRLEHYSKADWSSSVRGRTTNAARRVSNELASMSSSAGRTPKQKVAKPKAGTSRQKKRWSAKWGLLEPMSPKGRAAVLGAGGAMSAGGLSYAAYRNSKMPSGARSGRRVVE